MLEIISIGVSKRKTSETQMNVTSSRSHTCFTINLSQIGSWIITRRAFRCHCVVVFGVETAYDGSVTSGVLNLVDLAGSERIAKSGSSGLRLQEAVMINSSLSGLQRIIIALHAGSEGKHVPYRCSVCAGWVFWVACLSLLVCVGTQS